MYTVFNTYLDTVSSLWFARHWLIKAGGGDRGEREGVWSNYLLKGGSWPSIVTVLYIYYIYFPVTLDTD